MRDYREKVTDLLANAEQYHGSYYTAQTFRGPSLYFHHRAVTKNGTTDFTQRLEYVYAALTAWGMHRMGQRGSKMLMFEEFHRSVMPLRTGIEKLEEAEPDHVSEENWKQLEEVFKSIKIMASGTTIVGNSKVMAHLLPNLVAPIDREYTLRYLRGNTCIRNGKDREWLLMKEILCEFFYPVCLNPGFRSIANEWMSDSDTYPWDTSVLKVVDNLIIGARKWRQKREEGTTNTISKPIRL